MKNQPVLNWSAITSAGIVALAVTAGLVFGFDSTELLAVLAGLGIGGPLVSGAVARTKVTPLSDPRDNRGRALHPMTPGGRVE